MFKVKETQLIVPDLVTQRGLITTFFKGDKLPLNQLVMCIFSNGNIATCSRVDDNKILFPLHGIIDLNDAGMSQILGWKLIACVDEDGYHGITLDEENK